MLRRLSKLIRGGKRVRLIGGPGNGMTFVIDGRAQSLEYEVKNVKHYYKWDGLTDGKYNLYSYLGAPNQGSSILSPNISNPMMPGIPASNFNMNNLNMPQAKFDPDAGKFNHKLKIN